MRFYVTEKLGPKQALTPEGFLLCFDAPIARTGNMIYGPGEVPVDPGPDGIIKITRDEDEVFRPEHVASYAGKPVVNDHPPEDVRPDNWKKYAIGTIMNPRRGDGMSIDLILADLIITEENAIKAVRSGKTDLSCGYDADYEETGRGVGRQLNLIGNHVALVDSGRCGPRCAIGDHKQTGDCEMMTRDEKFSWATLTKAVKDAFAAKDEKALDAALASAHTLTVDEGEATHIHIHGASNSEAGEGLLHDDDPTNPLHNKGDDPDKDKPVMDEEVGNRLSALEAGHKEIKDAIGAIHEHLGINQDSEAEEAIEGELEEEAPPGTGDRARKARDSVYLEDSFQDTVAMAEIIVPGIRIPTFDRALKPRATFDAICKLRRNALDLVYASVDGRGLIDELLGGKSLTLDTMDCGAVRGLFRSVAALKKTANNNGTMRRTGDDFSRSGGGDGVKGKIRTPADLNRLNQERWSGKQA